jgi:RNA polymerase sigma-70 factor (ECF subfamily)
VSRSAGSVPAGQRAVALAAVDREADGRAWLGALRSEGAEREAAAVRLHALLLRAARFELERRRGMLAGAGRETVEDLATQSADDALSAILSKLDEYRFESRFTTWAYKFAILEAAVRTRRRAWQERELPVEPDAWAMFQRARSSPRNSLNSASG